MYLHLSYWHRFCITIDICIVISLDIISLWFNIGEWSHTRNVWKSHLNTQCNIIIIIIIIPSRSIYHIHHKNQKKNNNDDEDSSRWFGRVLWFANKIKTLRRQFIVISFRLHRMGNRFCRPLKYTAFNLPRTMWPQIYIGNGCNAAGTL